MEKQFEFFKHLSTKPSFLTDDVLGQIASCKNLKDLEATAQTFEKNFKKNTEIPETFSNFVTNFMEPSYKYLDNTDIDLFLNRIPIVQQYNNDKKNKEKISSSNLRSSFKDKLKGTIVLTRDNSRQPVQIKGGSPDCFPIISYGTLQTFAGSLSVVVGLHFTAASVAVASAAVASTLLSLAGPIGAGVICVGLMVVLGGYLYCKYSGAKDEEKQGYDIQNVPLPPVLIINKARTSKDIIDTIISKLLTKLFQTDVQIEQGYWDDVNKPEYTLTNYDIFRMGLEMIFESLNYYGRMRTYSDLEQNKSINEILNTIELIGYYNGEDVRDYITDKTQLDVVVASRREDRELELLYIRRLLPILWYTKKEFEASSIERLFGKTKKGGKTPSRLPYEKRLKQDLYKLAVSRKLEVTKKTTKSDLIQLLRK